MLLTGVAAGPGTGAGPVRRLADPVLTPKADDRPAGTPEAERKRALDALEEVAAELEYRASKARNSDARDVLRAQALMARDPGLAAGVAGRADAGHPAARAIAASFEVYRKTFAGASDYIAARVADLDDLRDRAIARVYGCPMPGIPDSSEPFVLVAHDLAPADTALLDPAMVLAFVTEQGGPTSHTAILARALGIPAVVACDGARYLADGTRVLVDGTAGTVRVDPSATEVVRAGEENEALATGPGRTKDGHLIPLLANVGGPQELAAALSHGAEGVGLYRTEFLFLDRSAPPSVPEQVAAYREVLAAFPGAPVVVRVLDAGADKPLGFLPPGTEEPNPALGERGLRLLARHPHVLADQLAALAEAARGQSARLQVMAPMVTDVADARWFAQACVRAGIAHPGIMVEVPSAALRARDLAAEVEFVSLGTNDLAQYCAAADRQSGALARLQDPWQPAVLDLIAMTAETSNRPCGVCGEAAADPLLACVLVGLGATSLSMGPAALPSVRTALARHTLAECRQAAKSARGAPTPQEARTAAQAALPA